MKQFLQKLPLKFINIGGVALYLLLFLILGFAGIFSDDVALSVISGLIVLIAESLAIAAVPVLLLLKKRKETKIVFAVLATYWLISNDLNQLGFYTSFADAEMPGIMIAIGVFAFFVGLTLLGVLVLLVLSIVFKNKPLFKDLAVYLAMGAVALLFIEGILLLVMSGKYESPWTTFMSYINDFFILPVTLLVGFLYFFVVDVEEAKQVEEKKNDEPASAEKEEVTEE